MVSLSVSIATGDYDRTRPLINGEVQIDGVAPAWLRLEPEEIFFRAMRHAEFDVCELSLSSYAIRVARGDCPYIAVPVFPSRAFRHSAIYVRSDRGIDRPEDLIGRRLGTPEYQLTACVWARAVLDDDYGVRAQDVNWVRGGIEQAGRVEKIAVALPEGVSLTDIPPDRTLSQMLADGEIDGIVSPRSPSCYDAGHPAVKRLFVRSDAAAAAWFERTGIFPIMHVLGVRRSLAEAHPWLPATLVKAFTAAKSVALARLADTSASKVMLPFVEERLEAARGLMGDDFWSYGYEPNRAVLDFFLRHHHRQGLSARLLGADELFHPATRETMRI